MSYPHINRNDPARGSRHDLGLDETRRPPAVVAPDHWWRTTPALVGPFACDAVAVRSRTEPRATSLDLRIASPPLGQQIQPYPLLSPRCRLTSLTRDIQIPRRRNAADRRWATVAASRLEPN